MSYESVSLVTNAQILDTRDFRVVQGQTIEIVEGRVARVRDSRSSDRQMPNAVDAAGKIVMPGLIDSHVHVTAVTATLGDLAEWSPNYVAARSSSLMSDMLHRGFTTVRDVAGADWGLSQAVEEGYFQGPRLFFGGKSLSQTGGHGDMRGPGQNTLDSHPCCPAMSIICDGVSEVRKAAREQLRTGAQHLKIMLSGGVASRTDRVDSIQFSEEEIRAIVEEAEAANRYVTGHAYTARAVNRGLRAGVRSIEHGNLIDAESVELFKEHGAFLVPTLVTYVHLKKDGAAAGLPLEGQKKVDDVLNAGLEALALATKGGVKIAFGTDLLGDMQIYQSEEFAIRAQVQTNEQIVASATTVGAELLGAGDELGTIQAGAHADLLMLDGNPLDDIG
ncbi:MAG: amidohydrolase family protein, partial [Micrococcaceae bacterium]|nr:amidohydrolase family protein [Micrococcaceae bacterium]